VFERYTEASRASVFCARFEASLVGSPIIDTEHLLLGLLRVDPSTLQAVAEPLSLDSVRKAATRWHDPRTRTSTSVDLPLGPEAKQSMLSAALIADSYSSSMIRSEHHLMALICLTGSHAAIILEEAGASRRRLEEIMSGLPKDQEQPGDPAWRDIRNEL
jgi:ATP-dependent Clp protease ATP-binding subunit ClpC